MKRFTVCLLLISALLLTAFFAGCGEGGSNETEPASTTAETPVTTAAVIPEIKAVAGIALEGKELSVPDENHTTFAVDGKIRVTDGAEWAIFRDEACIDAVGSRTVELAAGENIFWIKLTLGGESNVYRLTIVRSENVITAPVEVETTAEVTTEAGPVVIPTTPEDPFTVTDRGSGDEVDFPG